ncbi:MAG: hypothetical protein A3E87_04450 [Gammaproteobacteria bacterium RIFCSPHIGHO2_12_FULL_35_23]|nr:MAG: hypothetical protein A3E87_04450 [Gammaproteobacteria bacterium RIFCSPHIGHO2_12_FULL_35_23]
MITPLSAIGRSSVKMLTLFAKQCPKYANAIKQLLTYIRYPEFSRSVHFNSLPCDERITSSGQSTIRLSVETMRALDNFLVSESSSTFTRILETDRFRETYPKLRYADITTQLSGIHAFFCQANLILTTDPDPDRVPSPPEFDLLSRNN